MLEELADGLWRWTARHPEWHPGAFGAEVASFAARAQDGTLVLVDPLLPPDADEVLALLDGIAGDGRVVVAITIPYHVRDAASLAARLDGEIVWHRALARRLPARAPFRAVSPGDELAGGARVLAIGRPRRYEQPLWLPAHRALCFGDAIVQDDGALRVWAGRPIDDDTVRFYRERFAPSAEPLLALDPQRILVTHGAPVLTDGRAALQAALDAPPWNPPRAI